ncbi:DNA-binding transcriptional regulator, MocR family, contains an aminotransferase domain [Amycolatopsis arida]|uniref:DNA-binding transcriptional regulator, MocR family, contains an aminotransferase domain n=1 Tax=Amycolatopsis arida TaxID=587909 RepID=A0A1I5YEQ8_9PSEU|nr:PLP-dependent aminotransferase family protein [Amycolatopsis arida]TDX90464.1 DNA-binding transcriptional MocR family regulator [Amycolatopsis arida]SFQ42725.1 DNA-binding transcriptional regulator, MocR family, contains an aminotransferase domain [Amycolatopsis arida]
MSEPLALDELVARLGRWSAGRGPLYVLLATRLRRMIDDGELLPDTALPPDRRLAAALAVGRSTVVAAYDQLCQDGKIVRRQGSGTRVAPAPTRPNPDHASDTANPLFLHLLEPPDGVIQLTCAAPDRLPSAVVAACAAAFGTPRTWDIGYHPAGLPELRRALAARYTGRGLPADPNQILVTSGAQQALSLLVGLLVGPGEGVVVEAPTFPGALEVVREAAAVPRPVPVGPDGLDPAAFREALRRHRPAAAYLIPSHHNPTGAVLSTLERRRIAEAAAELEVPLIDDEVLAELGFSDVDCPPPPPLAAFGPDGFTVGSLSKIVWGGLRLGWVRGPAAQVARLARRKAVHDFGCPVPVQVAAVEVVAALDTVRAERVAELRERHGVLCAELAAALPSWRFRPAAGGQTLWVRLPHGDAVSFAQAALRHGVAVLPGNSLDASGSSGAHLRIPFLAGPEELAEAVRRLAAAWRDYAPAGEPRAALAPLVV